MGWGCSRRISGDGAVSGFYVEMEMYHVYKWGWVVSGI